MNNGMIKFFGYIFFPCLILGMFYLFVANRLDSGFLCVIAVLFMPETLFFFLARSISKHEKNKEDDEKQFLAKMNEMGYCEVQGSRFKVRMTGRFDNELSSVRFMGAVMPVIEDEEEHGVSDRYSFYNVGATTHLVVHDDVSEEYRMFMK